MTKAKQPADPAAFAQRQEVKLWQQALDALPFVSRSRGSGRCFWSVKASGDYSEDCRTGEQYAALAWAHRLFWGRSILADIAIDQIRQGERTGIEVGYHRALDRLMSARFSQETQAYAECFGAIAEGVRHIMGACANEAEAALGAPAEGAITQHILYFAGHVEAMVYDEARSFTRFFVYPHKRSDGWRALSCPNYIPLEKRLASAKAAAQLNATSKTRRRLLTLATAAPIAGVAAASEPKQSALSSAEYRELRAIVTELGAELERASHFEDRVGECPERDLWEETLGEYSDAVDELVQIPVSTISEVADKFTLIARMQCNTDEQVGQWDIELESEEALALLQDIRRLAALEAGQ